jgi:uncharacterized protein
MKPLTLLAVLVCGAMMGFGLAFSTMIRPEVVLGFLRFHDMGLLLVLGGSVVVATLAYQFGPRLMQRPVLEASFGTLPIFGRRDTLVGDAIFGIGWGLCGVCPGPAIAGLGAGNWPLLYALGGIFAGAYLQGYLASRST